MLGFLLIGSLVYLLLLETTDLQPFWKQKQGNSKDNKQDLSFANAGQNTAGIDSYFGQGAWSNANVNISNQRQIEELATNFYNGFLNQYAFFQEIDLCSLFEQLAALDDDSLKAVADKYQEIYGISMLDTMENSAVWCIKSAADNEVHKRLKQL